MSKHIQRETKKKATTTKKVSFESVEITVCRAANRCNDEDMTNFLWTLHVWQNMNRATDDILYVMCPTW